MKIDLSRRCECGRKPGHGDRKFYEGDDRFGMYCGSCGRMIVKWRFLSRDKKKTLRTTAQKHAFSDWTDGLFGRG